MAKSIVLLGSPGAGKDTVADQLKKTYRCEVITPGSIFREEARLKTPLGLKAKEQYWGKGLLCPDNITNALVKSTLNKINDNGLDLIVFNGYPRSLKQAIFLQSIYPVHTAIDLNISEKTAMNRLLKRKREDDTEKVIKERINVYMDNNNNIVDYYKKLLVYVFIDASQSVSEVFSDVSSLVHT